MPPLRDPKNVPRKSTKKQRATAVREAAEIVRGFVSGRPSEIKDTKSDSDRSRAPRYKKTRPYKKAAAETYKAAPLPQRKRLVKATKGKKTPEAKAIQQTHKERTTDKAKAQKAVVDAQKAVVDAQAVVANFIRNTRPKIEVEEKKGSVLGAATAKAFDLGPKILPSPVSAIHGLTAAVKVLTPDQIDDAIDKGRNVALLPATVPKNIAQATVEDPRTLPKSLKGAAQMVVAAPAGVVAAITDPEEAWKQTKKDYARRYGPLIAGDEKKFRRRLKKEGAASEVLDLAAVTTAGLGSAGRAAASAAKTGKLGKKAKAVATQERPRRQVSGGESVPQVKGKTLQGQATQRAVDKHRLKKQAKKVEKAEAGGKPVDAVTHAAHEAGTIAPGKLTKGYRLREAAAQKKTVRRIQQRIEQQHEVNKGTKANLSSLSKWEREAYKYAIQLGLPDDPKVAVKHLETRAADIKKNRDPADSSKLLDGRKVPRAQDELPKITALIANADKAFTPKLRQVVEQEDARSQKLVKRDPGVRDDEARERRIAQQAEHLGVKRGGIPVDEVIADAKASVVNSKRARKKVGKKLKRAERVGGTQQGRAEILGRQADTAIGKKIEVEQSRLAKDPEHKQRRTIEEREDDKGKLFEVWDDNHELEATYRDHALAAAHRDKPQRKTKAERQEIIGELERSKGTAEDPKAPVRTMAAAERKEADVLALETKLAKTEKTIKKSKKLVRKTTAAKNRGERLLDPEPLDEFIKRVEEAAKAEGLKAPGYHPSTKRSDGVFSAFAIGGTKATELPKKYEGELFRTGRESNDPEVYASAIARNIKRRYQWTLVAEQFDANVLAWSRSKNGGGMSIDALKDEIARQGINPKSVAFWNPGIYGRAQQAFNETNPDATDTDGLGTAHDYESSELHDTLNEAAVANGNWPAERIDQLRRSKGWVAIPKVAYDEIMAETKPSGKLGRGFDIAKGKSSRILLGNPAWLQLQIASNAFLTGLSGTGPVSIARAQLWWKKLTPEQRQAVDPYIGVQPFFDDQIRLGAASDARIVNAYRALKETSVWRAGKKVNPLDLIFRTDNAQNNIFRKAVLYNRLKRSAYTEMGSDMRGAIGLHDKLAAILEKRPEQRMRDLLDDQRVVEQHAEYVNRFLGNYTRYTAAERRRFGRFVMFYGFLRFSLRFTLYTMPAKHPIVAAIMGELGALHVDEMEKLFGEGGVPPWELGNFYAEGGKKRYETARLNPFFNATQYVNFGTGNIKGGSAIGFLPPFIQALGNQVATKNIVFGRDWQTNGETEHKADGDVSMQDRFEILVADAFLNPNPIYRTIGRTGVPGLAEPLSGEKQGADSLGILKPAPIRYKQDDALERNQTRRTIENEKSIVDRILEEFVPAHGEEGRTRIQSAKEFAKSKAKKPEEGPTDPRLKKLKKLAIPKGSGGFDPAKIERLRKLAGQGE